MVKIAMIGAGSVVFSKRLTADILSFPEFHDATLAYMDVDQERLQVGAELCRRLAKSVGAKPKIEATMERRKALAGADFVINMVQIGGFNATLVDFEVPRKYGLNFTIADTTGPGGFFRALRTYPMLKGLCADMMELCPNATLLNYSNPMTMNMQTVFRTSSIKGVGLCHGVQGTHAQMSRYIGEKPEDTTFLAAGINHMSFFLQFTKGGTDLYPRLWQAMQDPKVYGSDKVRFELMKMFGYFMTESSEHSAEYSPWFMPHGKQCLEQYAIPIDEYLRRCDAVVGTFDELKKLVGSRKKDAPLTVHRSHEYGSNIIHSLVTGQPRVVYGNLPNNGAISNLPATAVVETPTLVDRSGMHLTRIGELPPAVAAYVMPHIAQHELFMRAATEGRRDYVYQAAMFDPLTAATVPLDKIVEMCDELIAGHGTEKNGGVLPNLDAKKTMVPTSIKRFRRVDPATLRASWHKAQKTASSDCISEFSLIGPFPGKVSGSISLDDPTPVEAAMGPDGCMDLKSSYEVGGNKLRWKKVQANERGYVDLVLLLGNQPFVNACAYAEIEEIHGRDTTLCCGSDDGIRIWLNGEEVHKQEATRGHKRGQDSCPIHLKAGTNRILVKVDQYAGGWGFSVEIPKAAF